MFDHGKLIRDSTMIPVGLLNTDGELVDKQRGGKDEQAAGGACSVRMQDADGEFEYLAPTA